MSHPPEDEGLSHTNTDSIENISVMKLTMQNFFFFFITLKPRVE